MNIYQNMIDRQTEQRDISNNWVHFKEFIAANALNFNDNTFIYLFSSYFTYPSIFPCVYLLIISCSNFFFLYFLDRIFIIIIIIMIQRKKKRFKHIYTYFVAPASYKAMKICVGYLIRDFLIFFILRTYLSYFRLQLYVILASQASTEHRQWNKIFFFIFYFFFSFFIFIWLCVCVSNIKSEEKRREKNKRIFFLTQPYASSLPFRLQKYTDRSYICHIYTVSNARSTT